MKPRLNAPAPACLHSPGPMIIALCIAQAHDHRQYVAYVQPAAMQGGDFVVLRYAKPARRRDGREVVEIPVTAVARGKGSLRSAKIIPGEGREVVKIFANAKIFTVAPGRGGLSPRAARGGSANAMRQRQEGH